MRRRERFTIPGKYILFVLTVLCVGTMSLSFLTDFDGGALNVVSGYVLVPVQRGINAAGGWLRSRVENLEDLTAVKGENELLREQIAELTMENNSLMQERYELEELRKLYELDAEYGVMTRVGLHCAPSAHQTIGSFPTGTIRFSFGWWNTPEHVDAALRAMEAVCHGN